MRESYSLFFLIRNFEKEALGIDEFFAELRMNGILELGQIEEAIVESPSNISIFYLPELAVKKGLPIMLDSWCQKTIDTDYYAGIF